MITVNGDWFALETANTGYYLGVRGGLVENLHYGARVRVENSVPLREKTDIGYGGDVVYRAESAPLSLEHLCLELSPLQKGDYRAQSLSLVMPGGARTADFSFVCARRLEGSVPPEGMPAARGGAETLALDFSTPEGVAVTLFYTVYPDCDVITRRLCIKNGADAPVTLEKALSYQLDLPAAIMCSPHFRARGRGSATKRAFRLRPERMCSAAPPVLRRHFATRFSCCARRTRRNSTATHTASTLFIPGAIWAVWR